MTRGTDCKTKYPIIMLHGFGFRDERKYGYWGRIPQALEQEGAVLFYGYQDGHATIETNAQTVKKRILEVLEETHAEKVNIIAHSKGGLEARYVISTLGMDDKIASLSTMGTPHNGSASLDRLVKISDIMPRPLFNFIFKKIDEFALNAGDKNPDTLSALLQFQTAEAEKFNSLNPDSENVYYQSYAFVMKNVFSDPFMFLTYFLVKIFEHENSDGLLSPKSTHWTNFRGVYTGHGRMGISHRDEIDLRRKKFSEKKGEGVSDIVDFYVNVVKELKKMGY